MHKILNYTKANFEVVELLLRSDTGGQRRSQEGVKRAIASPQKYFQLA